ncbi:hypothetical protein B2J88_23420 [Rhodococcus sp. SRB_17]|nr:hypothetical protein [Rhodococcus sp. SRB_17]
MSSILKQHLPSAYLVAGIGPNSRWNEPEVPAGDAGYRGYGLVVGEVVGVKGESELIPVEFTGTQW